ncbi:MAG TPA: ArsB/NhaD family transporter [Acidothermaceae bacterium]
MSETIAVAVFVIAYIAIASEKVDRVVIALAGAGALLALRVVDLHDALHSESTGIDWAVLLLLFGMMVIVGVLARTGAFEYLGIWTAKKARGRPFAIMAWFIVLTAVASALLDNVTTVLLVAPVTAAVTARLGVPLVPYLIAEALASNIGGSATLVGDPPNIVIGSRAGLSYADFLFNLAPLVVVLLAIFVLMSRVLFRRSFAVDERRVADLMALEPRQSITDVRLLVQGCAVLVAVTVAFTLAEVIHIEPAVIAALGAGALLLIARRDPVPFLREVEWPTLAFFAGLFIMVGALVKVGAVDHVAKALADVTGGHTMTAAIVLVWGSGLLSAVVDNIPYVATMTPVVAQMTADLPAGAHPQILWWALALGADLGGNATIIGASANVVIAGTAARQGHPISFGTFARYGVPTAVVTLAVSTLYIWLRYSLLA